ncbi:MAG TPA: enoyl-CoA hydratase/isomerase family protein, partial [Microthrixaceae bacterium]|nr:enoyl-CoA hydratase/isomerase family protein [Microthrixaceae bacterium]
NALDATMWNELERAWRELDDDPDVRVIVNTGNGAAFQTGLDMVQLSTDPDALREQSRATKRAELPFTSRHQEVVTPVICAVNGTCAGGGLHFVVDADIVILASDATFVDPHVSLGQVSAFETIALSRRMAFEPVMRMALLGRHERITAQRAYDLGMASQIVDPPDRLRDEAQMLGETIARNSPTAMAVSRNALWRALEVGLTEACVLGAKDLTGVWGHEDQNEGPLAFAEKRDAVWGPLDKSRLRPRLSDKPHSEEREGSAP